MKNPSRGFQRRSGFTLTEIMIVVAIIALLATIALPNFQQSTISSRRGACVNNLRLLDAAKEQYALAFNKDSSTTPASADITPYLNSQAMPNCPAGGSYTISALGTKPSCSKSASPDLHAL